MDVLTWTLSDVYDFFLRIEEMKGSGSEVKKIDAIEYLLKILSPIEAKYLIRIILEKLRIGVKEQSLIRALANNSKYSKNDIELAYNICSDLGRTAEAVFADSLDMINIEIGNPIRMMAAKKAETPKEVFEMCGNPIATEVKYDGERGQLHYYNRHIPDESKTMETKLFSRNHNDILDMYPEIRDSVKECFGEVENIIVEGEIVAHNKKGKFLPFQKLMERKRKYDIEQKMKEIPVRFWLFDILYLDNDSLLHVSFEIRRLILERRVKENDVIKIAPQKIIERELQLVEAFEKSIKEGGEGLMCKNLRKGYEAGKRNNAWIKYKFDYVKEHADDFDLVVIGGFYGKGRKVGWISSLLVAAFCPITANFYGICRVGSGLTDSDCKWFKETLKTVDKPSMVYSHITPDFWVEPKIVVEVRSADLNLTKGAMCRESHSHLVSQHGITIRFPRFTKVRDDINSKEGSSVKDMIEAYSKQAKTIDRTTTDAW